MVLAMSALSAAPVAQRRNMDRSSAAPLQFGLSKLSEADKDPMLKEIDTVMDELVIDHKRYKMTGRDLFRRIAFNRYLADLCFWRDRRLFLAKEPDAPLHYNVSHYHVIDSYCGYGPPKGAHEKGAQVLKRFIELGLIEKEKIKARIELSAEMMRPSTWCRSCVAEIDTLKFTPLGLSVLSQSSPWLAWAMGHRKQKAGS